MDLLIDEINKEIVLLEKKKRVLLGKKLKAMPFKSIVRMKNNKPRYFVKENESKNQKYYGIDRMAEIRNIIQNEYDLEAYRIINSRLNDLNKIIKLYNRNSIYDLFENLHPARKLIVNPIVLSNEQFTDYWMQEHIPNGTHIDGGYDTKSGAIVRSKSEKIIADALHDNNITFVYESPIKKDGIIISLPDFTILDIKRRRTIYWEHFGLMDKTEYRDKAAQKILTYISQNIIPGRDLIITCEGSSAFDTKQIIEHIRSIKAGDNFIIPEFFISKFSA